MVVAACAVPPKDRVTVIPITWNADGNPCVAARWNERDDAVLMFHTGVDGAFVTRAASQRLPSLSFAGAATVTSWGGSGTVRTSTGNTLQLGERTVRGVAVTEDELSGKGTDGKFGPGLFGDACVAFDPVRSELRVSDALPDVQGFTRLPARREGGGCYVSAEVCAEERSMLHEFLLHTGYAGSVLLDEPFVAAHRLDGRLPVTGTRILKDALGNDVTTQRVCLPGLSLGGTTLRDVDAERFPGGLGSRSAGVLGCGVLRRFQLVFEPRASAVWVRSIDAP